MSEETESEKIRQLADKAVFDSLPLKSRHLYECTYKDFLKWKRTKEEEEKSTLSNSETIILAYLQELSERYKPASLWAKCSMIGSLLVTENVNIKKYPKVQAFLKQKSRKFQSLKSKVLTKENIRKFLVSAPDYNFLGMKVGIRKHVTVF